MLAEARGEAVSALSQCLCIGPVFEGAPLARPPVVVGQFAASDLLLHLIDLVEVLLFGVFSGVAVVQSVVGVLEGGLDGVLNAIDRGLDGGG